MYTDQTILSKGKYRFTALCRVPPAYLLNILQKKNKSDFELYEYVERNLSAIESRQNGSAQSPELILECSKVVYHSEKAAKAALQKIRNDDHDHIKPIRAYECQLCGGYHLTSWSVQQYLESIPAR
ncbi:hypothetical protein SNE26_23880 [Mucilaginibacter sp. cycad4]|uniref:hypothetical protein n=1 Tax=Mucilaginibacter sp. cycad4 TaxID=3342096 RepID=UPI002AAADB04|nr:hypothetical protein [Mucilaginibacter gossypii]WPU99056.1 hypothetical protein SNE26_23880 [Mucilaginibacter gossypii]